MHHIYCPYCEEMREEEEYSYTGEAHIERPKAPASIADEAWGDYLFFRANPRGIHHEMWSSGRKIHPQTPPAVELLLRTT